METIYLPRVEESRNLTRVVAFISALDKKKAWRIRIDEFKGERTDYQNNALFGVAYPPLCERIGCRPDELHEIMCEKFFGSKQVLGKTLPIRRTTTDEEGKRDVISWEMFSEFYAMVQQVGSDLGLWIPDPNRHLRTR
jgi:hypothetical protein